MKVRTDRHSGNVVVELESRDRVLPPIALSELALRRILVPVDFSECSRKAVQYAVCFARQFNSEVMLLHVVVFMPPPPQASDFQTQAMLDASYREGAAKQLSAWRNQIGSQAAVKATVRNGSSAHSEIVEAARESNSDLIIIGNHGRTGLARMLVGSTAEQVVRHAPCPVMVVRDREHDFIPDSEK